MTWVGALVSLYGGVMALRVDEMSASRGTSAEGDSAPTTVGASQVDDAVQFAHAAGTVSLIWSVSLVLLVLFAFQGKRWAATALLVMAGVVVAIALLSLMAGFTVEGVAVAVWSASASGLVRLRESSRDWYETMRRAQAATS